MVLKFLSAWEIQYDEVPDYHAFPASRLFHQSGNLNAKYRVNPTPWSLAYTP
ncbi:hypothetical protein [Pedobacter rhodius]|uniref:Uncharacterized protein n=1 Tax=Pedobacter rhodius TaxID=3004098 RepID=A0ABT4KUL9_9SPHI|nr:hypothetical protein [Pedobacter sp. SJ11]MCZ4222634.1 hypothetical protein [Pedobacter sp. SJ11]